jgi:hypothetical protein
MTLKQRVQKYFVQNKPKPNGKYFYRELSESGELEVVSIFKATEEQKEWAPVYYYRYCNRIIFPTYKRKKAKNVRGNPCKVCGGIARNELVETGERRA